LPKIITMKLKQLWFWILPLLKNKFTLSFIIFVGWIIFFDQNNLFDRVENLEQLHQLEKDKAYYLDKIKQDSVKLIELKTDKENLEKFAREQYLMKKKNEDIFIIAD
jgi:cell division protein DivIC